jgi:hypothetical protein
LDQPQLEANLPTPWMGLWERIDIFATMLWIAVLAIVLLRAQVQRPKITSMGAAILNERVTLVE